MNQLIKISEHNDKKIFEAQMMAIGAYALSLEYISRDFSDDKNETFERIKELRSVVEKAGISLPCLEYSVMFYAVRAGDIRANESSVVSWFFENLNELLPGASKIDKKSDNKNIPDGFIRFEENIYPVEVKRSNFDNKALQQLKRYIDAYGSKKGVAVARELTCDIPENIIFVKANIKSKYQRSRHTEGNREAF